MYFEDPKWQALSDRAARGDAAAARQLQQEMEPHMLLVVRRAMEVRNSSSPFARRIRRNVDVLASPGLMSPSLESPSLASPSPRPAAGERDAVLRRVARRLCHLVTGRPKAETVSRHMHCETVCA